MSTDLYGIRVIELAPEQRRVRLRVIVTYYDNEDYHDALLEDDDPSFFLRVLSDEADTEFGDGGPLGEVVSLGEFLDEDWVDSNTWLFIERYEAVASRNVPFTKEDVANLPTKYSMDGDWFTDEERLVSTDYDVWVTDPRWLAHLSPGQRWTTTSYPTEADRLRAEDAPYLPDPRPPTAEFTVFAVDHDDEDGEEAQTASGLGMSPDGRWLAVASGAGELVVYEVPGRKWVERLRQHSGVRAPSVDWLPGRPVVVLQPSDPGAPSWAYDVEVGAVVAADADRWLARSADGRYRLIRLADGRFAIRDGDGAQRPLAVDRVAAAMFTLDGSRLYVGTDDKVLTVDPATCTVAETGYAGYRRLRSIAVDRSGNYLAVCDSDALTVLRLADGETLIRLRFGWGPVAVHWSSDGRWLVATETDNRGGKTRCFQVGRPATLPE